MSSLRRWTENYASRVQRALDNYPGNPAKLDKAKLESAMTPATWALFDSYRNGIKLSSAIRCALSCQVCPLCQSHFLGTSNGRFRAHCKSCKDHPRAKFCVQERIQATLIEKHGSLEAATAAGLAKKEQTCLDRFGVPHSFQADSVKERIKSTLQQRYQVDNPSKCSEIQRKKVETSLARYGTTSPRQAPEVAAKIARTLRDTYGVTNISEIPAVKAKKIETSLARYGKPHHLQNAEVLAKAMLSAHRLYKVTTSRATYFVQGYERFVVNYLEKTSKQVCAQFDKNFAELALPDRRYTFRPDFYLPRKKTYVEVKSTWTLFKRNGGWAATCRKFLMANEAGYKIKLYLVLDKRRLVILPDDWYLLTQKKVSALVSKLSVVPIEQLNTTIERATNAEEDKIYDSRNFSTRRLS